MCKVIFNLEVKEEHIDHHIVTFIVTPEGTILHNMYRLGKDSNRPILMSFKNTRIRKVVLNNLGSLSCTKVRAEKDLSFEIKNRRNLLLSFMKAARSEWNIL